MGEDCSHCHLYYRLCCRSHCINFPISTAKKVAFTGLSSHSKPKSLGFLVFLLNSKHLGDMSYCLHVQSMPKTYLYQATVICIKVVCVVVSVYTVWGLNQTIPP